MLVGDCLDVTRTHLDDDQALDWQDPKLLPKLQEAYRSLMLEMTLAGLPLMNEVSANMTVPAYTTDLTTVENYPTDMTVPIWMKEQFPGQLPTDFIDMVPVDFLPEITQDVRLIWWCWIGGKIQLLGATNDTIVVLRYRRHMTVPTLNSQDLGVPFGESFLSYQTAALAYQSIGSFDRAQKMFAQATTQLDKYVRIHIRAQQRLPAKRRAYHRRFAWGNIIRGM